MFVSMAPLAMCVAVQQKRYYALSDDGKTILYKLQLQAVLACNTCGLANFSTPPLQMLVPCVNHFLHARQFVHVQQTFLSPYSDGRVYSERFCDVCHFLRSVLLQCC